MCSSELLFQGVLVSREVFSFSSHMFAQIVMIFCFPLGASELVY